MKEWIESPKVHHNKGKINTVSQQDLMFVSNQSIQYVKNCINFSVEIAKGSENVPYKHALLNWCLNWLQRQDKFIFEDGSIKQDIHMDQNQKDEIVTAVQNISSLHKVNLAANITFGGLGVAATLITVVVALPAAPVVGGVAAGALAAAPAVTAVTSAVAPILTNIWFGLGLLGTSVSTSKVIDVAIKNEKGIPIEIAFKTEDLNTLLNVTLKLIHGVDLIEFWKHFRE